MIQSRLLAPWTCLERVGFHPCRSPSPQPSPTRGEGVGRHRPWPGTLARQFQQPISQAHLALPNLHSLSLPKLHSL